MIGSPGLQIVIPALFVACGVATCLFALRPLRDGELSAAAGFLFGGLATITISVLGGLSLVGPF